MLVLIYKSGITLEDQKLINYWTEVSASKDFDLQLVPWNKSVILRNCIVVILVHTFSSFGSSQIGYLNIVGLFHQRISSTAIFTFVLENNLWQILHSLVNYWQKYQRIFSTLYCIVSRILCEIFHPKCEIKHTFVWFISHSIHQN